MGFANMYFDWLTPELALTAGAAVVKRVTFVPNGSASPEPSHTAIAYKNAPKNQSHKGSHPTSVRPASSPPTISPA